MQLSIDAAQTGISGTEFSRFVTRLKLLNDLRCSDTYNKPFYQKTTALDLEEHTLIGDNAGQPVLRL